MWRPKPDLFTALGLHPEMEFGANLTIYFQLSIVDVLFSFCCHTWICHSGAFQTRVGGDVQAALATGGLINSAATTVHLLLTSGDELSRVNTRGWRYTVLDDYALTATTLLSQLAITCWRAYGRKSGISSVSDFGGHIAISGCRPSYSHSVGFLPQVQQTCKRKNRSAIWRLK